MSAMAVHQAQPTLLAAVAHELRGPLAALQTTMELLDRDFDVLDHDQMRTMVSSMHRRAIWLRGLMENLLCTAAIGDGRMQVHVRPLDLREVFADVEPFVEPLATRKQQRIRFRAAAQLPMVDADQRRVGQALLNLVSNAIKYSDGDTMIDVSMTTRDRAVRVTVADRGPGIDPALTSRLFEPYFRAGRTDGDGVGIGLSVVRSIVEAHGGRLGVANRRGGGTVFWFELASLVGQTVMVRSGT